MIHMTWYYVHVQIGYKDLIESRHNVISSLASRKPLHLKPSRKEVRVLTFPYATASERNAALTLLQRKMQNWDNVGIVKVWGEDSLDDSLFKKRRPRRRGVVLRPGDFAFICM